MAPRISHALSKIEMLGFAALFVAAKQVAAGGNGPLSDEDVAAAVESELIFHPEIPYNDLDVEVTDGIVTIEGTVSNLLAEELAVRVAETIRGVRSVVEKIEVIPAEPVTDAQLAERVRAELAADAATEPLQIKMSADDGAVILRGLVDSRAEKKAARRAAKRVAGAQAVVDKIRLKTPAKRSAEEIEADVRARLRWDLFVDEEFIDVDVDRGRVELSGKVASAAEMRKAASRAWVEGVEKVETKDLAVEPFFEDETRKSIAEKGLTDRGIREAVEKALEFDARVLASGVEVDVEKGIVTLDGVVPNLSGKRAAVGDSRHTRGVVRVIDSLRIATPGKVTDDSISKKARSVLENNPLVDASEVDVEVKDGRVVLNGTVDSYRQKAAIDRSVARLAGVRAIDNRMRVLFAKEGLPENPYIEGWDAGAFDWYVYDPKPRLMSDASIAARVERNLIRSPALDEEDVKVAVEGGVVELDGEVDSFYAKEVAERNAYESGAKSVVNNLAIRPRD